MACKHLIVSGKVQGVFYRASAREQAEERGITGWIRNSPGGDVEIVAQGSTDLLEEFIQWCKKGPSHAKVDNVEIKDMPEEQFSGFAIRR